MLEKTNSVFPGPSCLNIPLRHLDFYLCCTIIEWISTLHRIIRRIHTCQVKFLISTNLHRPACSDMIFNNSWCQYIKQCFRIWNRLVSMTVTYTECIFFTDITLGAVVMAAHWINMFAPARIAE